MDPTCEQCGDPTPSFVQHTSPWLGNPVLYMGRDRRTSYAFKFQFCDADCLLDWLRDVLGE